LLQELEDSGSDEIEAEHLPVEDVQDDGAILAVSGPDVFCNSHDFESFPQFAVHSDSTDIATPGVRWPQTSQTVQKSALASEFPKQDNRIRVVVDESSFVGVRKFRP